MPEGLKALSDRFNWAIKDVEARWWTRGERAERLSAAQLSAYRGHGAVAGWRHHIEFPDRVRRLDVLVTAGFPFVPARVALVDRPEFLTWPHVEKDGLLCVLPSHATVSVDDPFGAIVGLLNMAREMIGGFGEIGAVEAEFRAEFLSYWSNSAEKLEPPLLSVTDPAPPSRVIKVWEGSKRIVIGDQADQLDAWLANLYPAMPSFERRLHDGILVWLDQVPLPSEYPRTAKDIYALVAEHGLSDDLDRLACAGRDRIFVALGAATENGPAIVASVVKRPRISRDSDPITRGFRPSRMPAQILNARLFGPAPIGKALVERADGSWIHGRGHDERFAKLRSATVAVLGCGSVGAPVAVNLARAGVGKLILVDQQKIEAANIGRHSLGAKSINGRKAVELAQRIRTDLPHIQVEAHCAAVQRLLLEDDGLLGGVDLIVSALGDWPSESMLDEWHVAGGMKVPIVYGWTEPHAVAGHAVIVSSAAAGRLRDGVNAAGEPYLTAAQWDDEPRMYEPACGAAFTPYGPVELGFVTALIGKAALDCLLGGIGEACGTHRIWLGDGEQLKAAGGRWSPAIRQIAPHALEGNTVVKRKWGQPLEAAVRAA